MAIKTIEQITDDIDGSEGAEHVSFAFDGTQYTIDLSEENKSKLRAALDLYIGHATKVTGGSAPRRSSSRSTTAAAGGGTNDARAIRAWAAEKKIEVPARGRIPGAIVEQWKATQS